MILLANSELAEQRACVAFRSVATHFSEFAFELSCAHAIFFGEVGESIDFLTLACDLPESGVTHHHGVEDSLVVELKLVLLQHGHSLAGGDFNSSLIGFDLAAEDLEEGTL